MLPGRARATRRPYKTTQHSSSMNIHGPGRRTRISISTFVQRQQRDNAFMAFIAGAAGAAYFVALLAFMAFMAFIALGIVKAPTLAKPLSPQARQRVCVCVCVSVCVSARNAFSKGFEETSRLAQCLYIL